MEDSARCRDYWADVQKKQRRCSYRYAASNAGTLPSWGGKADEKHPGQARAIEAIEAIEEIINQADFCKDEYALYMRGRSNLERAKLYSVVLQVWKTCMGRTLGYTLGGPVERFLRAALLPVLGDETPEGTGIRDIIRAEKALETFQPSRVALRNLQKPSAS